MTSTRSPATERADLIRALAVLCERPTPDTERIAVLLGLTAPTAVDYTELLVHQLPPYASIYLDDGGGIGGEPRERIAGFWRATGFTPPADPDHLAALLGLWATLIDSVADTGDPARRQLLQHAQETLVYEHLAPWLIPYLIRIDDIASLPYSAWAALLGQTIQAALRVEPGTNRPPRHLAGPLSPPQDPDGLVGYLLAPVRSGIILTHADLNRAAAATQTGIRIGERAYALQSLLDQRPQTVLAWLLTEAKRQARQLRTKTGPAEITRFWISRTAATASILEAVREERAKAETPQ